MSLPQTHLFDLRAACFHGCFNRCDITLDEDGDISAAKLFLADDFDAGGLAGRWSIASMTAVRP